MLTYDLEMTMMLKYGGYDIEFLFIYISCVRVLGYSMIQEKGTLQTMICD